MPVRSAREHGARPIVPREGTAWIAYAVREVPDRLLRLALCRLYGIDPWHVATPANKPYVRDVLRFLHGRAFRRAVEVGCGLGDIIRRIRATERIGLDVDPRVVAAARLYLALTGGAVRLQRYDLICGGVPTLEADLWILINWLHAHPADVVALRLRELLARSVPGTLVMLDSLSTGAHRHEVADLLDGIPHDCVIVRADAGDGRTIYAVTKRS